MKDLIGTIKDGGIGVIPTDTMYGIVGDAMNKKTVERIYEVRKRTPTKPLIILISSINNLKKFDIKIDSKITKLLKSLWPDKLSIILPCPQKKFEYLHRGTKKLAFRFPNDKGLVAFIKKTGPIVAPSANTEGDKPSKNIKEAQKYFGSEADFYLDGGTKPVIPSTIIELDKDGKLSVLRKGAVKLKLQRTGKYKGFLLR